MPRPRIHDAHLNVDEVMLVPRGKRRVIHPTHRSDLRVNATDWCALTIALIDDLRVTHCGGRIEGKHIVDELGEELLCECTELLLALSVDKSFCAVKVFSNGDCLDGKLARIVPLYPTDNNLCGLQTHQL